LCVLLQWKKKKIRAGFDLSDRTITLSVFERAKKVQALDRAAAVTGYLQLGVH
jgi:hypothetical protein